MKTTLRLFIVVALLAAGQAFAVGNLVDVSVYDRQEHRTVPVHHHEGRLYLVGKPGNEYQVVIRNRSGEEVLAVVSVDGVNAVTGETASYHQSGYVIGPGERVEVAGWRKSLARTAAFYFTELGDSYAARTGRPENVGVIGVAVFRKNWTPPAPAELSRERAPAADSAARSAAPGGLAKQESLGTGHGRSEHSPARYVEFERASSTPDEVVALYYDSYHNLLARGVIQEPKPARDPQPFPARFVPDPPYR